MTESEKLKRLLNLPFDLAEKAVSKRDESLPTELKKAVDILSDLGSNLNNSEFEKFKKIINEMVIIPF